MRSSAPATRQAAGAPSAWSQPFKSTHKRPRRWCDAGSLGRQGVTADQKAGDEGSVRDSGKIQRQGQRPRQKPPGHAENPPHRGAGHGFVPEGPRGDASRSAQGPCRAPAESATRSALPATRQAAGAPSAWSQPFKSTHSDHADGATLAAGTPQRHSGPEGRCQSRRSSCGRDARTTIAAVRCGAGNPAMSRCCYGNGGSFHHPSLGSSGSNSTPSNTTPSSRGSAPPSDAGR